MGLLEFSDQGLILVLADFLIEPELFQDHAAPPVEPPLGFARVGRDGAWDDGRQAYDLLQGKLGNILAEIMARGGLDSENPRAEFDEIEVEGEDPVLAQRFFQASSDEIFPDFAQGILSRGQKKVLGELLGDGAPARVFSALWV